MKGSSLVPVAVAACAMLSGASAQQAGSHTDLPRWCGKPYMSGSPNFNPGGQLEPPKPSPSQFLFVQVEPRHNIYVSSETVGSFIVDAALSNIHGQAYSQSQPRHETPMGEDLKFIISVAFSNQVLVNDHARINSTDNLFQFDLSMLKPQMDAYNIILNGTTSVSHQTFTATTQLFYLPDKTTGSVTKIDNTNGGMLFKNRDTNWQFEPLFAFGFYADYGGYLDLSLANVKAYHDLGFNAIHPIPSFSPNLTTILNYMDELNLLWQYDMRNDYQNLTSVQEQVMSVKDHSGLFAYYTADEPDGWEFPLNSTKLAYDTITGIDKYHPVGLVLNCQNFYFGEYSSGADFILEDAYPIGINATFSRPFGTPCNDTYGDCGCDNCVGEIQDVSNRLDDLTKYQQWLGQPSKPLWAVPQSFDGEGYWERNPTVDETWAMNTIAMNHGAKSIMIWTYPTETDLAQAHAAQAKVVTVSPVLGFLTGAEPVALSVAGNPSVDVAYWLVPGEARQVLVSVVNPEYTATSASGKVSIELPFLASSIESRPWGNVEWSLQAKGSVLQVDILNALATSMVILKL